jgi:hypothetical protein
MAGVIETVLGEGLSSETLLPASPEFDPDVPTDQKR